MAVRIESKEEVISVYLSGEIDHHNAKNIRRDIDEAVERGLPALLRLDFGGVEFMDSSGIGLVLGRYRLMQDIGGRLELGSLPAHIRKVMHLAGIDHLGVSSENGQPKEVKCHDR